MAELNRFMPTTKVPVMVPPIVSVVPLIEAVVELAELTVCDGLIIRTHLTVRVYQFIKEISRAIRFEEHTHQCSKLLANVVKSLETNAVRFRNPQHACTFSVMWLK